jgi:hypothetical protein
MSAKDVYHEVVKSALIKAGWTITHDPFPLSYGKRDMYVDLGAEKVIAAERGEHKIAVEVKSFLGKSEVEDTRNAVGQYLVYKIVMDETEPSRELFLALPHDAWTEIFDEPFGQLLIEKFQIHLFSFDPIKGEIVQWSE